MKLVISSEIIYSYLARALAITIMMFTSKSFIFIASYNMCEGFPGGSMVKNPPVNAGKVGSIPETGRYPGEENGDPL